MGISVQKYEPNITVAGKVTTNLPDVRQAKKLNRPCRTGQRIHRLCDLIFWAVRGRQAHSPNFPDLLWFL